ncbi:hypothetical protein LXA43DRAFT_978276 [Ganoderma leucocontextum]|nr:hypothetical protein LXA43DRAFT_978276 [Ganoderma leucocontextum]
MSIFQRTTKMDDLFAEQASWHAVRPGHPSLSLSVREITSVSVTFVLSSPYSPRDHDVSLASLGLSSSDDEDGASTSRTSTSVADTDHSPIVTDIIGNGFSVKVNGTPWRKVIVSKDDVLDEAIIIVHGLMPARQYDVELGIMPGEPSVRGQITTGASFRPSCFSSSCGGLVRLSLSVIVRYAIYPDNQLSRPAFQADVIGQRRLG